MIESGSSIGSALIVRKNLILAAVLLSAGTLLIPAARAGDDPVEQPQDVAAEVMDEEGEAEGAAGSDPLASVNKLDLIWQMTGAGGSKSQDLSAKGAFMLHPKLKLNSEVHYAITDVTGSTKYGWESFRLKPIFFPKDFKLSDTWGLRTAVGLEWILDFNHRGKGIGSGADQLAPLFGLAFASKPMGLTVIPLTQQFLSYNGEDVNATAFRVIALQNLPYDMWLKIDAKALADWENSAVPVDGELEVGKMLTRHIGVFTQGLVGVGGDRPYDWGVASGLRFVF